MPNIRPEDDLFNRPTVRVKCLVCGRIYESRTRDKWGVCSDPTCRVVMGAMAGAWESILAKGGPKK